MLDNDIKTAFVVNAWDKPYIETIYSGSNIVEQKGYLWISYAAKKANLPNYRIFKIPNNVKSVPNSVISYKPYIIVLEYGLLNVTKPSEYDSESEMTRINNLSTSLYTEYYKYCEKNGIKLVIIMPTNIKDYRKFYETFNENEYPETEDKPKYYELKLYQSAFSSQYNSYMSIVNKNICYFANLRDAGFERRASVSSSSFYQDDGYSLTKTSHQTCGNQIGTVLISAKNVLNKEYPNEITTSDNVISEGTMLLFPSEFKIAYLSNKWTKTIRKEVEKDGKKKYEDYFWAKTALETSMSNENSGIANWKLFQCADYEFLDSITENGKRKPLPKFTTALQKKIASYSPHIVMVEYGLHSFNPIDGNLIAKAEVAAIIESYQKIYEYCISNGLTMLITIYPEMNYSKLKLTSGEEMTTALQKDAFGEFHKLLANQLRKFASIRNLLCCDLDPPSKTSNSRVSNVKMASSCLENGEEGNGYDLTVQGHETYGKIVAKYIANLAMEDYNKNLVTTLNIQDKKSKIANTNVPLVNLFKPKEFKIGFFNTVYTDPYYEPKYDIKGRRIGTIKYYWPEMVSERLAIPNWKMFILKRRPLSELIKANQEAISAYDFNIAVIESGLFDYYPDMYGGGGEPNTRVADIISYYNFIYRYCIDHGILLIISTYGMLNYDYFKSLNEEKPLFTEDHKRFHSLLQEKIVGFCYDHDIFCCNIRLDENFSFESFSRAYLYDGVSLSREGHLAYSQDVAQAIKLSMESLNTNIKDTKEALQNAMEMTNYYNQVGYDKRIVKKAEIILKNINTKEDWSKEKNSKEVIIQPNYPNIRSQPLSQTVNRYMNNTKNVKNYLAKLSRSSTEDIELVEDSNEENKFQNIGSILNSKKLLSNQAVDIKYNPSLVSRVKDSMKVELHKAEREAQEAQRKQMVQASIMTNETSDQMEGDGQHPDEVVSFEICKMLDQDEDHHCKYMDIENRCIFDQCIFDTEELPKFTRKWYTKCVICMQPFARDPRYMKVPFCDSCLSRMQTAENYEGFTCLNCGKKQHTPSKIMFSSICDYCVEHILFNTCCAEFKMLPTGIAGVDTNHEPVY